MEGGRISSKEKYKFYCDGCKELHTMPSYCIAQLASGNKLEFSCACGNTVVIVPDDITDA